MPVVIEQSFPLGRFHATRWNQNPFEDRMGEWPPSPWRLLRALAARWFQYQRETGDEDTNLRNALLCALAGELPSFRLPAQTWRGQDIRQYQPTALDLQYKYKKNERTKKQELDYSFRQVSTTLALDGYRAVPSYEPLYWIWLACALPAEATRLLHNLLRRIHYFGRAETWTIMRLVEPNGCIAPNCELRTSMLSGSVPVLAHRTDQTLDIDLLLASTNDKQLSSRRIPNGTTWFYTQLPLGQRRSECSRAQPFQPQIQVVRYALDSTVLPLVTETLPVAEAARRALMGIHGRLTEMNGVRGRSDILSGKDEHGQRLAGHRHAYYLPTDEDRDGRLDHLTVYAWEGFGPDEQRAFDRLHDLRTGRQGEYRHSLRVLLLGMGTRDEYNPGPLQVSKTWVSATPYIATRYAKTRGRNRIDLRSPEARAVFLQEDLRAQLAAVRSDLFDQGKIGVEIEPLWDSNHVFEIGTRWRPIEFKRFRQRAGDDGGRRLAGAFRLTFDQPVRGPLALGWSSHFGLGLFVPE
jgi:CRISPR-associated protein Csb2